MLATVLNTNEVKNAAGVEVEFERRFTDQSTLEFKAILETPASPHRLAVKHQETGVGSEKTRRSVIRIDKTVAGTSGKPRVHSAYLVNVIPVGDIADYSEDKNVLAELLSFYATTGAGTTVLFDCSGNGASAAINGSL
jgi:hypothetical protein